MRAAGQQAQRAEAAQLIQQGSWSQQLAAHRRQLDRQGQAVQNDNNFSDSPRIRFVELETRLDGLDAPDEQLDRRAVCQQRLHRGQVLQIRKLHGRDGVFVLGHQVQARPAGHQQFETGGAFQPGRQLHRRNQDLLEIVQHQQELLILEIKRQALPGGLLIRGREPEGMRHHDQEQLRLEHRTQGYRTNPIGKIPLEQKGGLNGQAGLADPAGTGQGQQAHVRPAQLLADGL